MKLKKNDEIELLIESISSEGTGVGRYDGFAVFVDGAVTGDRIVAHIIKVKSSYAVGIIKKIIKASVFRIGADCASFERCGGCSFRQIDYAHELEMKRKSVEDALRRLGGADVAVEEILSIPDPDRYRNKGIYPVGIDENGKTAVGFFAKRSHRIVDCRDCRLAPEEFEGIINVISRWSAEFGVTVYDEESHRGLLRYIYLRKGFATGQLMVCLVINGDVVPAGDVLIERLTNGYPGIKSIVLNINKEKTNVALGRKCVTVFGADFIEDELCSLRFRISPLSFFQVNPAGCELLYARAREYAALKKGETLLDLYCGAGTIGLSMAADCKEVIGVEVIPDAVANAKANAELNGISNARFICSDAAEAAESLRAEKLRPDCVILDPPRKGCSAETVELVAGFAPSRIVYVSCDPSTLARDCKRFAEHGYTVSKATAVDMFPRTRHVECVTLMTRSK